MSIRKILYPVDLTGTSTANRIENEYITVGTDKYRAFTLSYAPFFADSLTLKERNATSLLKEGTDYEVLYFFTDLTKLAGGKRICGVVCITNTKVGTDLVAGYNTVGGHYANCASIIQQAIFDLNLDNRETYWQSVIDKPDLFQPTPHIHDIGDVYGLEFQIDTLIAIREAIVVGDNEVHAQILARIDEAVDEFKQYHAAHLADVSNSHKTTAHQVGTYTKEEIDDLFMQVLQEFADLEPRFKTIADEITDIYSKINAVNSALKGMSDRLGLAEQELSKFVLLLSPINQTLALLQGQIDNINLLISALQAKDVNLQAQIDALKTRADNNDTLNGIQNSSLDAIESKNTIQDNRLTSLENWRTTTNSTLTAYDTRLDKLETSTSTDFVKWASTTKDKWIYTDLINRVPYINSTGSMEIGNQITMHHANAPDPALTLYITASPTANSSTLVNSGYFNCQDIYVRSDIRDKRDITRLSPAVADDILRKLGSGIRYKLHDETVFTAGLAAQEVLEVFPEAIGTCVNDKGEQRLTMRQNAIIGLLVSGYNKQAAIIESLQATVDEITKG